MSLADKLALVGHFIHTRWVLRFFSRSALERRQRRMLGRFLQRWLPLSPRYAPLAPDLDWRSPDVQTLLEALPLMDKEALLTDFTRCNTQSIALEEAEALAKKAEVSRDFNPRLGDLTVGLSSGTSGQRGVFLVSERERARWAGILLAKTLTHQLLMQLLCFWRPRLRIAFFLRANSNLYQTLESRRIDFGFYDLLQGLPAQIARLNENPPQVLVAPASLLVDLANAALAGQLRITPLHLISVAEVLETTDAEIVGRAFAPDTNKSLPVHQIYQATEGFLGYTCPLGNIHLNETHLHIEKAWVDQERERFQPIVSDFSRTTQLILRYRLNDILRLAPEPCPCGRAETTIAAIEGRADEVLWLKDASQSWQPIYPDLLRRSLMLIDPPLREYRITQRGDNWTLELMAQDDNEALRSRIAAELDKLASSRRCRTPHLSFTRWQSQPPGAKRRRLQCLWHDPEQRV